MIVRSVTLMAVTRLNDGTQPHQPTPKTTRVSDRCVDGRRRQDVATFGAGRAAEHRVDRRTDARRVRDYVPDVQGMLNATGPIGGQINVRSN